MILYQNLTWPVDLYVPPTKRNASNDNISPGWHGWCDLDASSNATEYYKEGPFSDMRTIFMARGPAFG